MADKYKFRLTFAQWVICYAGALGFGGLTWWATGNEWLGGGVLVAFTAAYVFWLAGRAAPGEAAKAPVEGLSRQQKRALQRKESSKPQ